VAGHAGRSGRAYVRVRLVGAFLAADPLGGAMLIVVAVGKQAVAQRAQGGALFVVAARRQVRGSSSPAVVQQADGAQRLQLVMDIAQDLFVAFAGIAQDFPNLESGEAGAQVFEAGDGQR
jgi:hypothetical protein